MDKIVNYIVILSYVIVVTVIAILFYLASPATFVNTTKFQWPSSPQTEITNISQSPSFTGVELVQANGVELINKHCLGCHSDQLIVQNRMSRQRWEDNISWMQETQGLWDLGRDHAGVIDYLAEHYAPLNMGRRPNLDLSTVEWYELE